ncbi:DUF2059 domain-containing protein [Novosphingopyxis sp. YJ-S2-01]|uniref:DUF2059 domain-containing protein n=1 Tax=Novosphingopyxis sp. YJ-S2-01 TaxID=2794021 RepID=UPI0018DBA854|nr:DUF2059 domain-containing protein [Novosphingopyxis sp. YJ-S2-01]MBH9537190.1 DUF2059 domain-containing protein [Novosphingopyxis sp. YJ-S2-01]
MILSGTIKKTIHAGLSAFALSLAAIAVPASAQDAASTGDNAIAPEQLAAARELVDVSGTKQQFEITLDQMRPLLFNNVMGGFTTQEGGPELAALIEQKYDGGLNGFAESFAEQFSERFRARFPDFRERLAKLFARELSPEEIASVKSFVTSPVGRKYVSLIPAMAAHMNQAGEEAGEEIAVTLTQEMLQPILMETPAS